LGPPDPQLKSRQKALIGGAAGSAADSWEFNNKAATRARHAWIVKNMANHPSRSLAGDTRQDRIPAAAGHSQFLGQTSAFME